VDVLIDRGDLLLQLRYPLISLLRGETVPAVVQVGDLLRQLLYLKPGVGLGARGRLQRVQVAQGRLRRRRGLRGTGCSQRAGHQASHDYRCDSHGGLLFCGSAASLCKWTPPAGFDPNTQTNPQRREWKKFLPGLPPASRLVRGYAIAADIEDVIAAWAGGHCLLLPNAPAVLPSPVAWASVAPARSRATMRHTFVTKG
jgi:hypothetical protein